MSLQKKLQLQKRIHWLKTQPLSENDLNGYNLKKVFLHAIKIAKTEKKDTDQPLRILDVGCGRGAAVAYLLKQGHEVFGGEVDDSQVNIAKRSMEKLGFSPDVIVKLDLDSGRYHLPDNYFR